MTITSSGRQIPLRSGVHAVLEAEADRLIRESLIGVTSHSAKSDVLTAWKTAERYRREVYVSEGVPDASMRQGMFHRVLNRARPDLNSRDGLARHRDGVISTRGGGLDSLGLFVQNNSCDG